MFQIGIILTIWSSLSCSQYNSDQTIHSFSSYLESAITPPIGRNSESSAVVHIPHGQFVAANHPFISSSLSILGNETRISFGRDVQSNKSDGPSEKMGEAERNALFLFWNSSITLSNLELNCESAGSFVGRVESSSVVVSSSRLISNLDRSPFLVGRSESGSNSITLIDTSHTSSCHQSLLPLVSVTDEIFCSSSFPSHPTTDTAHKSTSATQTLSISGIGLSLSDCDLCLATGPLIGSLRSPADAQSSKCSIQTQMVGSDLVNMTSSHLKEQPHPDCQVSLSQSMIGTAVSSSTNHLYGTAILDMNSGGSLLCQNSSFLSCLTDLSHPTTPSTHHPNQAELPLLRFYRSTYKGCNSINSGGAIRSDRTTDSILLVQECSFDTCYAPYGGACSLNARKDDPSLTVFDSSSFVGCSGAGGGSLSISSVATLSITDCVFLGSEAYIRGGAIDMFIDFALCIRYTFTNSLFQNCKSTPSSSSGLGGGAIHSRKCTNLEFKYLQFRHCSSDQDGGYDVCVTEAPIPTLDENTVVECDSQSDHLDKLLYIYVHPHTDLSHLLKRTFTALEILSLSATPVGDTANLVVRVDKAVEGRLLVLLSNVGGERQPGSSGIPNIARLVTFDLSSSVTGSCSVHFGETGYLQRPLNDFEVTAASLSGHLVSFDGVRLPTPRTLESVECTMDEGQTSPIVTFRGAKFADGLYKVFLHDGSFIEVEFSTDADGSLIGSHNLDEVGDGTKWKEGSVWIVTDMKSVDDPSIRVIVGKTLFFAIPVLPSEVTGVDSPSLNKKKTEVSFEIVGSGFPSLISSVSLKRGERTITATSATMTSSTSISATFAASFTEDDNSCAFGEKYTLDSIAASKTIPVPSDTDITIPSPPTITSITTGPSSSPNEFVLKMEGTNLPANEVFLAQIDSFAPIRVTMSGDGTNGVSDAIRAGQSHTFQFDASYTVKTLRKEGDEDEHIIFTSSSFTTPLGPTLTSISCPLSASDPYFVVLTVGGNRLPDGQYFVVVQKDSDQPITIEVPIASNSGMKSLLAFGSGVLEYSGKYSVKQMWSESVEVSVGASASSFTVDPAPARIESALCVLSGDSEKEAKLTLTGSSLPVDKAITIKVKPFSSNGQIDGSPVQLDCPTADTISTIVINIDMYAAQPTLTYGTKYEVISLQIVGTPSVLNPNVEFSVPIEPVRVKGVSVVETTTTVKVKISGSGFIDKETYSVLVSGTASSGGTGSSHSQTVTVVASDATHAASSAIVLGTDESSVLRFGYTYTIDSITNGTDAGFVEGTPTFETPSFSPSSPHILSASVETNGQKTRMWIVLSGENLLQDSRFTLTLNDSVTIGGVMISSSEGRSEEVKLGFHDSLSFSSTYEVSDVSNSEGITISSNEIVITTPSKPIELTLFVCSDVSDPSDQRSGTEATSCIPIERAWEIAEILQISKTKMEIVESAEQSSPLDVSSIAFNMMSGQMDHSELILHEPSNPDSALLQVHENGECRLTLLSILVQPSSPSFVFISAEGGSVTIQTCSISSIPSTASFNEAPNVCSWSNGLLHLTNTTTVLSAVTMKNVVQGGVVQKGGELTISSGIFSNNGPTHSVFPSARQNVHCEEEGNLTIDKSSVEDTASMWIDVGDCDFTGTSSILASPLFVPSLNANESKSAVSKTDKTITLTLKGEMLIPCGLSLEVFEWNKAKDEKGKSEIVELSTDKTTKWTETEIVAKLSTETDVTNFSSSLEWRGRLVYGDGVVGSEWMVISGSGSGNKAEGGAGSKWWLPVIIVLSCALLISLVITLICCRRRQKTKLLLSNQELEGQQMDEMMIKDDDTHDTLSHPHSTDVSLITAGTVRPDQDMIFKTEEATLTAIAPSSLGAIQRAVGIEAVRCEEPFETVLVNGTDTLFNRLHKSDGHKWEKLKWKVAAHSLTKGLVHIWKQDAHSYVLSRLNPHNVVLDVDNTPCLVLSQQTNTQPTDQFQTNHEEKVTQKDTENKQSFGGRQLNGKKNEEDQRWEAPEVTRTVENLSKNGIDQAKACVFSLGLVMWEMATQLVPFGEIDGVNAHRQIGSGVTPRMDKLADTAEGELIVRCLALNPKERPTLIDVKAELEELLKKKDGKVVEEKACSL
ncbi:hypothetical protein BLNAU_5993 [Blattamonas nauphoetae]|uniref:Protein kinase domain-containing protein n=1 Tax=Blattamonas nauphoetae TaxID=2049346 RepID=A0ABQ9Y5F8_9EUKA|nr:hypothetical protein BLNAU_5993 [Blattamonas nauphoetae]